MSDWRRKVLAAVAFIISIVTITGAPRKAGLMNRPYTDMRRLHFGFSVGMPLLDMKFSNSGAVANDGGEWWVDQPGYSPGFGVGGVGDLRLNDWFNLRFTPGIYFGSRDVKMREWTSSEVVGQTLKSTYLVFPVDLKFSSRRYRNSRPYITGGVMPVIDVSKRGSDPLKLKRGDVYATVGLGCDFYLPYFKFIPEVKFCFGMLDMIQHDRPDLAEDAGAMKFTNAVKRATSSMVVLTFYFE